MRYLRAMNTPAPSILTEPERRAGLRTAMPSEWSRVDTLLRQLGAVRAAANAGRASAGARDVIERAIENAAEAVDLTVDSPRNRKALVRARQAITVAGAAVGLFRSEATRARELCARAEELRRRAAILLDRVNQRAAGASDEL